MKLKNLSMKKILFAMFSLIVCNQLIAQDCNAYFPLKTGNSYELTSYNDKDKMTSVAEYKVISVYAVGEFTEAKIHVDMTDEKGKLIDTVTYTFQCKNGDFYIDLKNYVSPSQMDAYKDMTITITGSEMVIPSNLTVGQTLADGTMHMDIVNNNLPFATMDVNMTNRKVESSESVTTSAGTFDCYKMTEDFLFKVATMGFGIPMNTKEVEWYSRGVGMVRSEVYSKAGKLMGYTVLTKLNI